MNGNEYRGASPHGVRSRRTASAAHRPIGWRAANRILNGQDGGPGTEDLHALIAIASATASTSAPAPASSFAAFASDDHARAEARAAAAGREAVLSAFRESAAGWKPGAGRRTGSRNGGSRTAQTTSRGTSSRHTSRVLVLRFTTAVLLVVGVGAAAASAGVLPSGMQRIARNYFGIGGVSAPSTHVPSSNAVTTGPPNGSGGDGSAAAPSGTASVAPASSAVVVALCQQIAQNEGNWETGVAPADQATLITAAGGEHKVKGYCAHMLAGKDKGSTPSPVATGTPSPAPSVDATETHGKAHVSHPPATHGAG